MIYDRDLIGTEIRAGFVECIVFLLHSNFYF